MNKKILILGLLCCLQACGLVDDYLLGKDNVPQPKALEPLKPRLTVQEKWSLVIGSSHSGHGYLKLKPSIVGDTIYVADASGVVQAIHRQTGKVNWSQTFKTGLVSGPAVGEGTLVVGTAASSVVVMSQSDGHVLWKQSVSGDVLSQALIVDHKVIVKTIDGHLYAFDAHTGATLWVADHGAPSLILKASSAPVMMDHVILVGFSDGKLDGIDLDSGRVLWQKSLVYASGSSDIERLVDIDADPIVRHGLLYLASYQGYVGALSVSDGLFVWNRPASVYKNMAMDERTLYLTDSHDMIWAIDVQTGQVNWKQNALKARGLTEPVLMGSWLIVGDKAGYLHILSTQNGDLLARSQRVGAIDISPVVTGHDVFVMTAKGRFDHLVVHS